MKFKNIEEFAAYYEKEARERGGRNDWRVGLARSSMHLTLKDKNVVFFEDYYVRVVLSLDTEAMSIERKENRNPVYVRDCNGEVYRVHGEWTKCQQTELVEREA